jgi:hypothetical protein
MSAIARLYESVDRGHLCRIATHYVLAMTKNGILKKTIAVSPYSFHLF